MERDLELYLSFVEGERYLKNPKEGVAMVEQISQFFTHDKSDFTIGLFIGKLFDEKDGIFTFIRKSAAQNESVPCATAAFKLLDFLVSDFKKCVAPYFPFLLRKCLYLFDLNRSKIKGASLKFIRNIIEADTKHSLDLSQVVLKLKKHLMEETKISATVLEQIYELLGFLFENYPESISDETQLLNKMLESLGNEKTFAKNQASGKVKGAFEGINGYLVNFPPTDAGTRKKIYEYIKAFSKWRQGRKAASQAGLKLIRNHSEYFSNFLFKDKEFWNVNLAVWIKNEGRTDGETAFRALCSFYKVIARIQKSSSPTGDNYLKGFAKALRSSKNFDEKRVALAGVEAFVLSGSLSVDQLNESYELVVNFIKKEESYGSLAHLPLSVECVSAFVLHCSDQFDCQSFLQKLSIKLIDKYPSFKKELRENALIALEKSFYTVGLGNLKLLNDHIERVLYLGLVKTSSLMTFPEWELSKEADTKAEFFSYKSYLSLWRFLLTMASRSDLRDVGSFSFRKGIAVKVFDGFFRSFIKIMSKLDFRVGSQMEVEKPSDIRIFINLVDLYRDLMPSIDSFNLQKWLQEILVNVAHLSRKNPLVSGFYLIMAASLEMADSVGLFDEDETKIKVCLDLMEVFIEDILTKVDHYKGDLQVACLKVVLVSPVAVVKNIVEKMVPALKIVTQLARNSLPLLQNLIEALERWRLHLPTAKMEIILKEILPGLDVYFQSLYFRGSNFVDSSRRGKVLKYRVFFNDSELLGLQKRFLMFLGNLESRQALHLIEIPDAEERRNIGDNHLVYTLPCFTGEVEINLDELTLRVIDLAQSCGDKRTRVTACELLYSLTMILLGNVNHLRGGYSYLFRKVVKACLLLGCDYDGLVSQIFQPLMYQITHYFSGNEAGGLSEAKNLVEILIDHVTCPDNPTVRDFSADLLRELTVWSFRQLSPERVKDTPETAKMIFEKIYSLALHPSYSKRLGAAVVFNKIYAILREEDSILNAHWFQLFYHFFESLRMCEESEDVTEITEAIRHLERPLVEKCKEFNENCPERVVPPEFDGGRLCHLVKWTMERACDLKPVTRRTAAAVVEKLAPLVENCDSNMSFFSKQLQKFFGLKKYFQSDSNEESFCEWLKYQTAGLEYCTWLLQANVLTVEEVFGPKFKTALKQFIKGVTAIRESTPGVKAQKQQAVLAFLVLLCCLKERAYLEPPLLWGFLKTAIFRPGSLGFDLNQPKSIDPLLSALTDLMKRFSLYLTTYDWENFYENLDSMMIDPFFNEITERKELTVENREFLFALKVIEGSDLWDNFVEKVFFSMNEDIFLAPLFKSLFGHRGKTTYALDLEPHCKLYLEQVLEIMLKGRIDLKGVMKYLENSEEVREEDSDKIVKKGEYFLYVFKDVIVGFLERKHNALTDWVLRQRNANGLKLLIQVLENGTGGSDLPFEVLTRWGEFESVHKTAERKNLLLRLAFCGAKSIGTRGLLKTSPVADTIYDVLEREKLDEMNIAMIEMIFGLLPFVSTFAEGLGENERLRDCLSKVKIDPKALTELREEKAFSRLHLVLEGFLQCLKTTGSLVVFDFILSKAVWFDAFWKREDVESALTVFADAPHSADALQIAYGYCCEGNNQDSIASIVRKLFLIPLLRSAPVSAVYRLVSDNLDGLCSLITTHWGEDASKLEILSNLGRKISAAVIFQIFVTRMSKEELRSFPKEKRQMLDATVKKVFFFLQMPYPLRVLRERYRKLMCEIFNMICCIVSARCNEEKFYKLFIFDDRGSFLFEAIDKNAVYDLGMDFEEIPKRKKHVTILRETVGKGAFGRDSVRYVQTNTVFTSSLLEDVTRFDLTDSFVRPVSSAPVQTKNVEIDLEMDSLNSHECMATLVATVSKMVRDKIPPQDNVTGLPCWLRFFLNVLKNPERCENLKLFVLKAMYNLQEFVGEFCEKIFPDLVDAILNVFKNRRINYLFMDLVEMMIGWKHVPEDKRARSGLTELVEVIMGKSNALRRDVVKYEIDILKLMIEVWKEKLYLPKLSERAFKQFSKSVEEDLTIQKTVDCLTYLNLHACGVLLSNGIPAWKEDCEGQFFDLILMGFREECKYGQLFAEICGLALNYLAGKGSEAVEAYERLVREKIDSLPGCWSQLLYGVHKHHPRMSSMFTFRLFSSAWDSMDSLSAKKLEMLLSHLSGMERPKDETFSRHAVAFVLSMTESPNDEVQEMSLRLAEKLLYKFEGEDLKLLVGSMDFLQRKVHSGVRKRVYEVAKKLYGDCPEHVFPRCKAILLRGLSDGAKELEEFCLEFWRNFLDFSSPEATLLGILKEMYSSEVEGLFLSSAARVLLRLSLDDGRSQKEIFINPIVHRCRFRRRNLILGTRQSFLLSLASSGRTLANHSLENVTMIRHENLPHLRPTLESLKFQPTVQENFEDVPVSEEGGSEESRTPANPFKNRFVRSEMRTSYFLRWRKEKEDKAQKKEPEVEIFGEYRDGDYPDIQIRHSQIARQLEALAKADPQTARLFLVAFYSGLTKTGDGGLPSKASPFLENMLKSSGTFDPEVFGFVFQVMLNHGQTDIDCELISNAAISSNCTSLGALAVEQIIADKEGDEEEVSPKRPRGYIPPEERKWLELAKLYRSLGEFDVVSGIFLDKINVDGKAREAVQREAVSDWAGALKRYESVLSSYREGPFLEFYMESFLSCAAQLSRWAPINECIRKTVNNDLSELWYNYFLLWWFVKSEMMIALETGGNEFRKVIEDFCKKDVKRDFLVSNFGEEMTIFDWFSDSHQSAILKIEKLCLDHLSDWSHINRWCYDQRSAKLGRLQTLSELSFATRNLAESSQFQVKRNIFEVGMNLWRNHFPSSRDELTVWDVKLGYRREFFRRMKEFDVKELREVSLKADLALAEAALSQDNLGMTIACLRRVKGNIPEWNFELQGEYNVLFNRGRMLTAKLQMKDPNVGLDTYLSAWNEISKRMSSSMETESGDALAHAFNIALGQIVSEILPFVRNPTVSPKILTSLRDRLNTSEEGIERELRKTGLNCFEAAIAALETTDPSPETKSNACLELSKFLLKYPGGGTFKIMWENLLKSMEMGNAEAREWFGCLLNIAPEQEEDCASFEEILATADRVPPWMFLGWINQMLARSDSELSPLVQPLLIRVTLAYPNAIRYPLRLMEEVQDQKWKSFFCSLRDLIPKDRLYDDFWNSVRFLAPPRLILSHHLEKVLQEASSSTPDYRRIEGIIRNLQEIMFSENYAKFRGPVFGFWKNFKEPLEGLLKGVEDQKVLMDTIKSVLSSVKEAKAPSKRMLGLLESYCPWLSSFRSLNLDRTLELPGQYDGGGKPTKDLVTVSSFKNAVVVFNSKCKPMKVTVLGNDAREYKFLVKFGEDLRQDERIQQVFRHFNHRLRESKQTWRFHLDTYKVVPLTSDMGMIEWVDDSVSLFEMVENGLGNDTDAIARAQSSHLSFLQGSHGAAEKGHGVVEAHLMGYENVKRENAVSNFRALVQQFPRDLLKKSFLDLSTSPEHFAHLRKNFATSHAVMCITHWLIGVGDRHLQNTLVSAKTGRAVGIDFGYAFGFATQFLTPPELLPFRLSPQILNLAHPLRESGWIKQTMIHCLKVFRKESFRLRSVLEVFAEEPVINWLVHAKKNPNFQAEDETWHPREKLDLVEKKLAGANPVATFETDLRAGHSQSKTLPKYVEVLKGVPPENFRARCGEDGLSEEEQVECLIDLATDAHVLAKTYVGWNPWL